MIDVQSDHGVKYFGGLIFNTVNNWLPNNLEFCEKAIQCEGKGLI